MDWFSYFIALGLPVILNFVMALLAVIFIDSTFVQRLCVCCLAIGLVFELFWILFGLMAALAQVFGD